MLCNSLGLVVKGSAASALLSAVLNFEAFSHHISRLSARGQHVVRKSKPDDLESP